MSVSAIGGSGGVNLSQLAELYRQQVLSGVGTDPATDATSTVAGQAAAGTRSSNFGQMIGDGLQQVENLDQTAATKAVAAATGDLTDVHDYVIAATQAQVATELTTTLRNKALDSFNEIMRMPL
jgi:flagellar hook-basal body complex protein FliE